MINEIETRETDSKKVPAALLALQIWLFTNLSLAAGWALYNIFFDGHFDAGNIMLVILCSSIGSLPVLVAINISLPLIRDSGRSPVGKIKRLGTICFAAALPYTVIGSFIMSIDNKFPAVFFLYLLEQSAALWACSLVALLMTSRQFNKFFAKEEDNMILSIEQDI